MDSFTAQLAISECQACSAHFDAVGRVTPEIKQDARVMVVSQSPIFHSAHNTKAYNDHQTTLRRMMEESGFESYVESHLVHCMFKATVRQPLQEEVVACHKNWFRALVDKLPELYIIVCMGVMPTKAFCGKDFPSPYVEIGNVVERSIFNRKFLCAPVMHPLDLCRSPEWLEPNVQFLKRVSEYARFSPAGDEVPG